MVLQDKNVMGYDPNEASGSYPDFHPNVAGDVVHLKDGIQNQRSDFLSGKNVLILGTATDGPVLNNTSISSVDQAEELFGNYYTSNGTPNGATLTRNYKRVVEAGADNIDLMRISGQESEAQIPMESVIETVVHESKENAIAEGNLRTKIDLEIPRTSSELLIDGVQYDNARVNNVKITASDRVLSSSDFSVNNENGKITVAENVCNSGVDLEIDYDLELIRDVNVPEDAQRLHTQQDVNEVTSMTGLYGFEIPVIANNEENTIVHTGVEDPIAIDDDDEYSEYLRIIDANGENLNQYISSVDYAGGYISISPPEGDINPNRLPLKADYVFFGLGDLEVPQKVSGNEYMLEYTDIVPGSESIQVNVIGESVAVLSPDEYDFDYNSGVFTIYDMSSYSDVQGISYQYRNNRVLDRSDIRRVNSRRQEVRLNNKVDASKPVTVAINGNQLNESEFSVSFQEFDTSIVYIEPGNTALNDAIEIKYYWQEEKYISPSVQAQSVFGGSKYNQIRVEIKDNIVERLNVSNEVAIDKKMIEETATKFVFPENGEVVADSVYIEDHNGVQLVGKLYNGGHIGAYLDHEEFDLVAAYERLTGQSVNDLNIDPDDLDISYFPSDAYDFILFPEKESIEVDGMVQDEHLQPPYTTNYAYKVEEQNKYTVERGHFNPSFAYEEEEELIKDQEPTLINLGGGHYENESMQISSDRSQAYFLENNILPNYYEHREQLEDGSYEEFAKKLIITMKMEKEDDSSESLYTVTLKELDEIKEENLSILNDDTLTEEEQQEQITKFDLDFIIDYAKGEIEFTRPLGIHEKIEYRDVAHYNISSKTMLIHKPKDKYEDGEGPIVIDGLGTRVRTMAELLNTVNNHRSNNNIVNFTMAQEFLNHSTLKLKTPKQKLSDWDTGQPVAQIVDFFGGRDEIDLTKEEIYDKLEGTEEELGAYNIVKDLEEVDILLLTGVYADDELLADYKNFSQQLADFCAQCFLRNNEIRGIIGVNPIRNTNRKNVIEKQKHLEGLDTDFYMTNGDGDYVYTKDGNRVDIGRYISIVGYDKIYSDENLEVPVIESGAADFAGVASMVAPLNSPTNEAIPSGRLAYQLSTRQVARLNANKIISARIKRGVQKIADAITCAQPRSGWTRYFTVDIVFDAIDNLRGAFDKYIGAANNLSKRASLDSDIRDALNEQVTLVDYDYNLIMDPRDPQMSRVIVELNLVPAGEMRRITTIVSINASLD